ncbi:Hypothetical predicted protein [Octopus vulgaris]|uniref:Endonuclease/exonuclease/phosphatase domain-containing protein n=1 Tax=Octopus vulgaris TaxID=6645 RepID=A0AA36EX11_OCTVU|nr:Hypothetical predicted protein [Octopus vulgaris]
MLCFSVSHDIHKANVYVITFSMLLFQICLGSNVAFREYYGTRLPPPLTAIPEDDKLIQMSNIRSEMECFSHCVTYSECGMIIYSVSEKVCILRKIKQLPGASSFIDIPANSIYTMLQAQTWKYALANYADFQTFPIQSTLNGVNQNQQHHIVQIYAPTADAEEDEIEQFYAEIQGAIEETPRTDVVYILGDFNANNGEKAEADIVGKFGLGERNEVGDRLVQFCQEQNMRLTNTWFRQPRRRLYTWTSPSGQYRNQIDNILCQQRWKSSVQAVKTFLEADCGSDHEHLVAKIKIRFCNVKRPPACQKFVTNKIGLSYVAEIRSRFELLAIEAEDIWENVKEIVVETAEKHVLYKKPTRSAKWISEETYAIAEERRRAKVTRSRD